MISLTVSRSSCLQDDPAGSFLYARFKMLLDLTEKFTDVIQKKAVFLRFFCYNICNMGY